MEIIKASGEKEEFSQEKFYQSLQRAGAKPKLAEKVCKEVVKGIYPGMNTEKILDQTIRCLQKEDPIIACRYNLKRAIMELGPTGFPFERYIAEIFKEYGYITKVGQAVKGDCVDHEIDVIALKENKHLMIECKYHNSRGMRSDIKVTLYTHARFLDVKTAWEKAKGDKIHFHQAWLVTNTKCTNQAIRYARCVGLRIISWRYPRNESLEYLIEKRGLYPITVLPSLTKYAKERLAQQGIILAKDLLEYPIDELMDIAGLQLNITKKLQEEVKELCLG